MTSKTLLSKNGLIFTNLKRFWWTGALYSFVLFFTLPFQHLMMPREMRDQWMTDIIKRSLELFSYPNDFQRLIIATLPVALAVLLYRYLMTSKTTAMMHSLPYNRRTLYLQHFATGLILLLVPVLLTGLIFTGLNATTFLGEFYSFAAILRWTALTSLFNVLVFSMAVFVGMFTGNSIAQIAFTYILNILPVGIFLLYKENVVHWLYGYSRTSYYEEFFNWLPMFKLVNYRTDTGYYPMGEALAYFLVTLLFFILAGYAYKKRHLEAAGDVIAFPAFRPIFKYGVVICGMLLGGTYFAGISQGSLPTILFGYLISSFLSYWIAEIVIQKSFRVWHTYKGYLAYVGVMILLLIGIQVDVFGYVGHIPQEAEIEKIYFGNYSDVWRYPERLNDPKYEHSKNEGNFFFEEPKNIKNIMRLHSQLIQNSDKTMKGPSPFIVYMLKNGKYVVRQYAVDEKYYAPLLKPIYESMEYKEARYPLVAKDPKAIKWFQIKDNRTPKSPLVLGNNDSDLQELMNLLHKEIRTMTFEELTLPLSEYVYMEFRDMEDRYYHYGLRSDFESVIQWLKDKGYYENVMLLPQEVEYAALKTEDMMKSPNKDTPSPLKPVEIRDPKIIEELLRLNEIAYYEYGSQYVYVEFYVKMESGYHQYQSMLSSNTPVSDELKAYLDQLNQK